ncbi:unnamed protein product [Durusdinium trenchii]|uniref:Uncharacterized protein n=2 Tax=Durusdinium trenchii TaxID=1381693 RepID=A0ABP0NLR9_9DINO
MLHQVLRLRPGSGKFTAPVCSSWVFLSRGSTGRTSERPLGRRELKSVEDANIMVARIIILLLLCESRKVWWTLEQPVNSLLERQPLFQAFLRFPSIHVRRLTTSMGWFGGKTRKPTWVYSSHPEVFEINDFADRSLVPENSAEMVVHYVDGSGKKRIKGGGDLKASQAYPTRFGRAVSKVRSMHAAKHRTQAARFLRAAKNTANRANCSAAVNAKWTKMANLEPILDFLAK